MKTIRHFRFAVALTAAGLICAACSKPDQAPTAATNATSVATAKADASTTATIEPPKTETNKPPVIISAMEAKNHVGEMATVTGKVFDVYVSQKGDVFIHIGGPHPNQPFTAVCFQGAIPADDLKKFNGKNVKVTGKIKDYNGQIEIVLERAEQITE